MDASTAQWAIGLGVVVATQITMSLIGDARLKATIEEKLSNLKEDVKDMQRSKLDVAVHDVTCQRFEGEVRHLGNEVKGVSQRVAGLESSRHYGGGNR